MILKQNQINEVEARLSLNSEDIPKEIRDDISKLISSHRSMYTKQEVFKQTLLMMIKENLGDG